MIHTRPSIAYIRIACLLIVAFVVLIPAALAVRTYASSVKQVTRGATNGTGVVMLSVSAPADPTVEKRQIIVKIDGTAKIRSSFGKEEFGRDLSVSGLQDGEHRAQVNIIFEAGQTEPENIIYYSQEHRFTVTQTGGSAVGDYSLLIAENAEGSGRVTIEVKHPSANGARTLQLVVKCEDPSCISETQPQKIDIGAASGSKPFVFMLEKGRNYRASLVATGDGGTRRKELLFCASCQIQNPVLPEIPTIGERTTVPEDRKPFTWLSGACISQAEQNQLSAVKCVAMDTIGFLLELVGVVSTSIVVYGGFRLLISQDDDGRKNAKQIITYALIGLTVILLSYAIVQVLVAGKIF